MLCFLSVRNLAVIEAVELELGAGLTVLTGETGAGKSILVEAVGLLLGGRASADLVRTGEETANIEAVFQDAQGEELILRREITSQGRSRAYVNGSLATAAALKEVSAGLVDLHGQHEHQALLDPESHLDLLDEFAGLDDARQDVAARYELMCGLAGEFQRLRADERQRAERADFLRFQLSEIERVNPRPREDEELATAQRVLANAEKLRELCSESYASLYERDNAVLSELEIVWRRIGELAALDPKFAAYLEPRDAIKSQLEDLAFFLRSYGSHVEASPAELQRMDDRLAQLERLKRKFGPALDDVLARQAQLAGELADQETAGERASELERGLGEARAAYIELARALSERRKAAADRLAVDLSRALAELAMERTQIEFRFDGDGLPEAAWGPRGMDRAELFISPNPGEELRPLARIASGGELSRIMLALKTVASTDTPGKTLIFDEVDAGIGGRVADVVGRNLRGLADDFQVLCITHLPQITAYGQTHFRIAKHLRGTRTVTAVDRLDEPARAEELARMLGGTSVTDAVRATAREMLAARNGAKANITRKRKRN